MAGLILTPGLNLIEALVADVLDKPLVLLVVDKPLNLLGTCSFDNKFEEAEAEAVVLGLLDFARAAAAAAVESALTFW